MKFLIMIQNFLQSFLNFLLNAMCFITTCIIVIGFIYIVEKAWSMQQKETEEKNNQMIKN